MAARTNTGHFAEAQAAYNEARTNHLANVVTYNQFIKTAGITGHFAEAQAASDEARAKGIAIGGGGTQPASSSSSSSTSITNANTDHPSFFPPDIKTDPTVEDDNVTVEVEQPTTRMMMLTNIRLPQVAAVVTAHSQPVVLLHLQLGPLTLITITQVFSLLI